MTYGQNIGVELPLRPDILALLISYDPGTGALTWLPRPRTRFRDQRSCNVWNGKFAGKAALNSTDMNGYLYGQVFNRPVRAHRAAWAIHFGEWPNVIDHINGTRDDNRIANLRSVDHVANSRNLALSSLNTSGHAGVAFRKDIDRWQARISVNRKMISLGYFDELADAVSARRSAEKRFGFHENHGRS